MSEPAVPPFAKDPFTRAHDALWAVLIASPYLSHARPARYRRDEGQVDEDAPLTPDYSPEFRIRPAGGAVPNFRLSSSSARLPQNYRIEVATDEVNAAAAYYPAKFGLLRTLARAPQDLGLPGLVAGFAIVDADDTDADPVATHGHVRAWSGVLVVAVDIVVPTAALTQTT